MNSNAILLLARILLAVIFILAGVSKFGSIDGTAGYISSVGLPAGTLLAWAAAVFETAAGIALLAGYQTKIAAALLAVFCVFTAFVFHGGAIAMPDFPEAANAMLSMMNQTMMMKNLALAGGLLALLVAGAGSWSVDGRKAA